MLPGNFCSGIPFALKGDWQLGNRMIVVLFLAKFQSHLAWQSQCNGLPSSCNKLSFTTTSSFKTRFLRLQCSKLRDSKPDSIPVKELEGNSEKEGKWQSIFWQLNQYVLTLVENQSKLSHCTIFFTYFYQIRLYLLNVARFARKKCKMRHFVWFSTSVHYDKYLWWDYVKNPNDEAEQKTCLGTAWARLENHCHSIPNVLKYLSKVPNWMTINWWQILRFERMMMKLNCHHWQLQSHLGLLFVWVVLTWKGHNHKLGFL